MEFLIIKLHGLMQAWGEHSFEGKRPSASFPTYSGILGLLSACLGIRRSDIKGYKWLSQYLKIAVRSDSRITKLENGESKRCRTQKLTDFHTIKDARVNYSGLKSHETIITRREYLYDAEFTVAIWKTEENGFSLLEIERAIKKPVFTPFLGRRSCPITRPLFEAKIESDNEFEALRRIKPDGGIIYSETVGKGIAKKVRDVPIWDQPRQFACRIIYAHGGE